MDRLGRMAAHRRGARLRGGRGDADAVTASRARGAAARGRRGSTSAWSASSARIGDDDVLGSGFVIDGDRGLVLTAAHTRLGRALAASSRPASASCTGGSSRAPRATTSRCSRSIRASRAWPRCPTAPGGRDRRPAAALARPPPRRRRREATRSPASRSGRPRSRRPMRAERLRCRPPASRSTRRSCPEVSGGPVVDQAGPARRHGARRWARPARPRPRWPCPGRGSAQRLDQLRPGPRRVYVGWADQYRCVGRQHAYARAMHPGYRVARRAAQRAGRADPAARHGRDGRLMSVLTEHRRPAAAAAALGDRRWPAW